MTYAFSIDPRVSQGLPDWTKVFAADDHAAVWRYTARMMFAFGSGNVYFWRIL